MFHIHKIIYAANIKLVALVMELLVLHHQVVVILFYNLIVQIHLDVHGTNHVWKTHANLIKINQYAY